MRVYDMAIYSYSVHAEEAIKAALKDYYDKYCIEYDHKLFSDCASCGHCCET